MPLFEINSDHLSAFEPTTFAAVNLQERADLQRLLRDQIDVIAPDVLVIAEEFGHWQDSKRRIDLLGVDKEANLVVIELKRTDDGGHMELQSVRYASMVSMMTFEQAVEAYGSYLGSRKSDKDPTESLLEFLDWEEALEDQFAQSVKIVLASADFSLEITSSVLWLNEQGLDINCFRLQPYLDGNRVLLDIQQVIPLPEAEEYQVRTKQKAQREKEGKSNNSLRHQKRLQFWTGLVESRSDSGHLHSSVKPGPYNWIGTGSGIGGLGLNYSVRQHDSTVELYIDRGKDAGHENQQIFRMLLDHRGEIEKELSEVLEWQELKGKRACRLRLRLTLGGWRDDPEVWPGIFDEMINKMARFESVLRPYLDRVRTMPFQSA